MNISPISNNQTNFKSLMVIPKGKTQKVPIENFSKSLGKTYMKYVVKPAKTMKNDIVVNCNDNSVQVKSKLGTILNSFGNRLSRISSEDERVAEFTDNSGNKFNIEYTSAADAESAIWGLNFGNAAEKAKAVFDIQSRIEEEGLKPIYRFK